MKQYVEKIDWCIFIQGRCEYKECNNCDDCPHTQPTLTKHEDNLLECTFEKLNMVDEFVPCTANNSNTMAKTHMCDEVTKLIQKYNLKLTGDSPANLKQYPLFFILKKTIGLGVPNKIYANKNEVCVVIYENTVYIIAPRIDNLWGKLK